MSGMIKAFCDSPIKWGADFRHFFYRSASVETRLTLQLDTKLFADSSLHHTGKVQHLLPSGSAMVDQHQRLVLISAYPPLLHSPKASPINQPAGGKLPHTACRINDNIRILLFQAHHIMIRNQGVFKKTTSIAYELWIGQLILPDVTNDLADINSPWRLTPDSSDQQIT